MIIKYNKLHDDLVYEYKLKRLKDKDIAGKININRVTFYKWLNKHDSFRAAYEEAKSTDVDCLKSMRQRAIGYDYYEEVAFIYKGEIVKGTIKKHMPGDYKSNVYMLKDSGFDAEFEFKKETTKNDNTFKEKVHADNMTLAIEKTERSTGTEDDTPTTIIYKSV